VRLGEIVRKWLVTAATNLFAASTVRCSGPLSYIFRCLNKVEMAADPVVFADVLYLKIFDNCQARIALLMKVI
jgi:hypothetical protein